MNVEKDIIKLLRKSDADDLIVWNEAKGEMFNLTKERVKAKQDVLQSPELEEIRQYLISVGYNRLVNNLDKLKEQQPAKEEKNGNKNRL